MVRTRLKKGPDSDRGPPVGHHCSILSASLSDSMATFFTVKGSHEEDIVLSAELTMVYHGIMHHYSYLSMDCSLKLLPITCPD